jgi:hypothetical protein
VPVPVGKVQIARYRAVDGFAKSNGRERKCSTVEAEMILCGAP